LIFFIQITLQAKQQTFSEKTPKINMGEEQTQYVVSNTLFSKWCTQR